MPITERVAAELPATIKTADYTLVTGDVGREIQFESATAVTASLPAVAEAGNGYNVILRNVGPANLTIDPNGSETLDGFTSVAVGPDEWVWIRSDATEWKSVSLSGGLPQQVGSGNRVLIGTELPSGVASVEFTSGIDSSYDIYEFDVIGLVPATDNQALNLIFRSAVGPTWETTNYRSAFTGAKSDGNASVSGGTGETSIPISGATGVDGSTSLGGYNARISLFRPASASVRTSIYYQNEFVADADITRTYVGTGQRDDAEAHDGVRFSFVSGNVSSGTIKLYGIKN